MNANQARHSDSTYAEPGLPQHPVPNAINSLSATINGLVATADSLVSRLESVLLPALPPPPDADVYASEKTVGLRSVSPVTSQLVSELHHQAARIENIVNQLGDACNRLEV